MTFFIPKYKINKEREKQRLTGVCGNRFCAKMKIGYTVGRRAVDYGGIPIISNLWI